jgi:hypothetical protein
MAQKKYGKYLTREIIADSKYAEITAPIARYTGCRGGGQDALEAEWSCITQPVTKSLRSTPIVTSFFSLGQPT